MNPILHIASQKAAALYARGDRTPATIDDLDRFILFEPWMTLDAHSRAWENQYRRIGYAFTPDQRTSIREITRIESGGHVRFEFWMAGKRVTLHLDCTAYAILDELITAN